MRRQLSKGLSILVVLSILTGCIGDVNPEESAANEVNSNAVTVQTTTNQISSDYYRAVIIDGKYQLGASASNSYSLSSAGNHRAFEEGLIRISQDIFPTDQYYLQEGQIIDEEILTSWVARESVTNPEGLNPALPEAVEEVVAELESESLEEAMEENPEEEAESSEEIQVNQQVITNLQDNPIYLAQIMEKNIMIETEEGFTVGGIVIGLAMNSNYEVIAEDGTVYQQEITVGEVRERGRQFANIIVGRLRNTEELRSVPIVVGIFRNAPNREIAGGNYLMNGISREGNAVTDWTENNEYRVALPIVNLNDQTDQYNYFDNFQSNVLNFFPNLNGVSGEALYIDGGLASLNIEIISQFYGKSEIIALTQYITDTAQRTLPEGVAVEILVNSDRGPEAMVVRPANSTQYLSYVYNQ